VPTIRADRRTIQAQRRTEDVAAVERLTPKWRALRADLARHFAAIDDAAAYVFEGCASIGEWGWRRGYTAVEARELVALGHALEASSEVATAFLEGRVTGPAAAVVGRALADPCLVRPGDTWLAWAEHEPIKDLRRRLRERLEVKAQRELAVQELTVFVPARVVDDFQRARVVASRKERKALSDGQTFDRCVTFYLDENDPLRQAPGTRRVGPTADRPRDRYVPAEVKRALARRSKDRCEVPGCTNEIFVDRAHLRPHRLGSGREVDDLFDGCRRHHVMYDAGLLRITIRADGGRDYHFPSDTVLHGPPDPDAVRRIGARNGNRQIDGADRLGEPRSVFGVGSGGWSRLGRAMGPGRPADGSSWLRDRILRPRRARAGTPVPGRPTERAGTAREPPRVQRE
jgi:hypothetical protein